MINDLRVQRRRQEDMDDEADRRVYGADTGAEVLMGKTATDGSYPTTAQAVYKVELFLVGGDLKERAAPIFTDLQMAEYAANTGQAVPPVGTNVKLDMVPGGRLVFTYNG